MNKHFSPLRWTALTWLGAVLLILSAAFLNTIPSRISMLDQATGKLKPPIVIESYKDLPIPCGWPLRYVIPDSFAKSNSVVLVNDAPFLTGPATLSYFGMTANATLVFANLLCFIYLSQILLRRYSILVALALPLAFAILITVVKVAGAANVSAGWLFVSIVYFLPLLTAAVLVVRSIARLWSPKFETTVDVGGSP